MDLEKYFHNRKKNKNDSKIIEYPNNSHEFFENTIIIITI